jgi:hypothetical protein
MTFGRGVSARVSSTTPAGRLGIAENIDHIDREGQVGEPRIDWRAVDGLPGKTWIDADNPVAMTQQKGEDAVRIPRRIGREADEGDCPYVLQDVADLPVRGQGGQWGHHCGIRIPYKGISCFFVSFGLIRIDEPRLPT